MEYWEHIVEVFILLQLEKEMLFTYLKDVLKSANQDGIYWPEHGVSEWTVWKLYEVSFCYNPDGLEFE